MYWHFKNAITWVSAATQYISHFSAMVCNQQTIGRSHHFFQWVTVTRNLQTVVSWKPFDNSYKKSLVLNLSKFMNAIHIILHWGSKIKKYGWLTFIDQQVFIVIIKTSSNWWVQSISNSCWMLNTKFLKTLTQIHFPSVQSLVLFLNILYIPPSQNWLQLILH